MSVQKQSGGVTRLMNSASMSAMSSSRGIFHGVIGGALLCCFRIERGTLSGRGELTACQGVIETGERIRHGARASFAQRLGC